MSKVQGQADLSQIKDSTQFMAYASRIISSIVDVINGNLDINGNLNIQILKDLSFVANQDNTFTHSLGRVPQGYWCVSTNNAGTGFALSTVTAPTATTITWRTGSNCVASLLIF